jgi:hypothetical protein
MIRRTHSVLYFAVVKGCRLNRLIESAVVCVYVVVAVYGYVSLFYQKYHVRFWLTDEAKDGDQIRTGSSVLKLEY